MTVYVVMSNDFFPDAVFASEEDAKAYVFGRDRNEKELRSRLGSSWSRPRIHWRIYPFEVRRSA